MPPVVVERLLSISGEDAQTVDRKNLSQVTCKLPVRFAILTNELPRLNDASGALVGRILRQTFPGRQGRHHPDGKAVGRATRHSPLGGGRLCATP